MLFRSVHSTHVDLEDAEIEVIEPVALGDRVRQLFGRDRALVQEHALWRRARRARPLGDVRNACLIDVPELDEHVSQKPAGSTPAPRRPDPGPRLGGPLKRFSGHGVEMRSMVGHERLRLSVTYGGASLALQSGTHGVDWRRAAGEKFEAERALAE